MPSTVIRLAFEVRFIEAQVGDAVCDKSWSIPKVPVPETCKPTVPSSIVHKPGAICVKSRRLKVPAAVTKFPPVIVLEVSHAASVDRSELITEVASTVRLPDKSNVRPPSLRSKVNVLFTVNDAGEPVCWMPIKKSPAESLIWNVSALNLK